jgi:RNA polymerase sigma-70 factor (ECF subfamily)
MIKLNSDTTNEEHKEHSDDAGSGDGRDRAQAMSNLFREHNRALTNFLLSRLRNEEEAKEVAQEAYVRLLQLHEPVATSFLRWYLFKIAKDLAIDRHRQRAARGRIDRLNIFEDLDASSPTESSVIASDQLVAFQSALKELPAKCQQAFVMHRFLDLSIVEVAGRMGLSDRMVRKYIHRTLVYCRLRMTGMSVEEANRLVKS